VSNCVVGKMEKSSHCYFVISILSTLLHTSKPLKI
jgi:hypothetical protein